MTRDMRLWILSPFVISLLAWHLPARAEPSLVNETGTDQLAQDSQPESLRIVVTGDNNIYYTPETSTGIVTPILENPQSNQIIPQQVLR